MSDTCSRFDELDKIIDGLGLRNESIAIRSTGCPNGCGRPFLGGIGLVGKSPGKYNLYLGAGLDGMRLNKLFLAAATHDQIMKELRPILKIFPPTEESLKGLAIFVFGPVMLKPPTKGADFHQ